MNKNTGIILWIIAAIFAIGAAQVDPDKKVLHQGASQTDWALPGLSNYQYNCVSRQNGSIAWQSPTPQTSGNIFVTYPKTYGGGNTPLLIASVAGPTPNVLLSVAPTFAGAYIYWSSETPQTYVNVFWIAEGVCK